MNEAVRAFTAMLQADADLLAQVSVATTRAEVIAIANTRGVTLTDTDFVAASTDEADLSDEALESASGGGILNTSWMVITL